MIKLNYIFVLNQLITVMKIWLWDTFVICALIALMTSCETSGSFESECANGAILLRSLVSTDDAQMEHLLYVQRLYNVQKDHYLYNFQEPLDTKVSLKINGEDALVSPVDGYVCYRIDSPICENDCLTITVSMRDTKSISVETSIPPAVNENSVYDVIGTVPLSGREMNVDFMFTPESRYYAFCIWGGVINDSNIKTVTGSFLDGVIAPSNKSGTIYYVDNIDWENGPVHYSVNARFEFGFPSDLILRVYSLAEDTYNAIVSESARTGAVDYLGVLSPSTSWTNVTNGRGYFCGFNYRDFKIEVRNDKE